MEEREDSGQEPECDCEIENKFCRTGQCQALRALVRGMPWNSVRILRDGTRRILDDYADPDTNTYALERAVLELMERVERLEQAGRTDEEPR